MDLGLRGKGQNGSRVAISVVAISQRVFILNRWLFRIDSLDDSNR